MPFEFPPETSLCNGMKERLQSIRLNLKIQLVKQSCTASIKKKKYNKFFMHVKEWKILFCFNFLRFDLYLCLRLLV